MYKKNKLQYIGVFGFVNKVIKFILIYRKKLLFRNFFVLIIILNLGFKLKYFSYFKN